MHNIDRIIRELRRAYKTFPEPAVTQVAHEGDPFKVLISCLLSLRTKDDVTAAASQRLFAQADTPEALVRLPESQIVKLVYPVGFYNTKAGRLREVSRLILEQHGGQTPSTLDELLALPGVGRKTANLVVTLGFGLQGICVDTHVHRISNRLGLVETKPPEKTEFALRESLPAKYWIEYNDLLVAYGQSLCTPTSPWCSKCRLAGLCPAVGVDRKR